MGFWKGIGNLAGGKAWGSGAANIGVWSGKKTAKLMGTALRHPEAALATGGGLYLLHDAFGSLKSKNMPKRVKKNFAFDSRYTKEKGPGYIFDEANNTVYHKPGELNPLRYYLQTFKPEEITSMYDQGFLHHRHVWSPRDMRDQRFIDRIKDKIKDIDS